MKPLFPLANGSLPIIRIKNDIFFILLFILYCSQRADNDIIAKVGTIPVYTAEFQYRYNFNPHLHQISDTTLAKRMILSALIAEKLLSLENKQDKESDGICHQYLKESMIEQLRMDSVESTIHISEDEIWQELEKWTKEVEISFIAIENKKEALDLYQRIVRDESFEHVVRTFMDSKGWQNESIPGKKVYWGEEPFELEELIFSMKNDEISKPVFSRGKYYIIKINHITQNVHPDRTELIKRKAATEDRLRRKRIAVRYKEFYNKNIRYRLGNINRQAIKQIFSDFNLITKENIPLIQMNKSPLSDLQHQSLKEQLNVEWNHPVIHFNNGSSWSMGNLLGELKSGPYIFDYSSKTNFYQSLIYNIELLLEHQAIYHMSLELGYEKNLKVLQEYSMWYTYFHASRHRRQLLQKLSTYDGQKKSKEQRSESYLQKKRLDYLDRYLANLAKNTVITINKKNLNNIILHKTDMAVQKTHFAGRPLAPPLEPLFGMPHWAERFEIILLKNGIDLSKN